MIQSKMISLISDNIALYQGGMTRRQAFKKNAGDPKLSAEICLEAGP